MISSVGWFCRNRSRRRRRRAPPPDEYPVRALLLVHVEPLAVVTPHAFGHDDLRPLDRAPLAGLLAELAAVAFRPALDAEDRQLREQPQRGAEGTQESAVEISHEDRRDEQRAERDPQSRRRPAGEHPERLDVAIDRHVLRREKIDQDRRQQHVLDLCRLAFDAQRHIDTESRRHDRIEQLRQRAVRADAAAVQPSPEHRGHDGEPRKGIPAEVVLEQRQVAAHHAEDVDDRQQLTLVDAQIHDGGDKRQLSQPDALAKEARERERRERREHPTSTA